jgi:hypothetical protein
MHEAIQLLPSSRVVKDEGSQSASMDRPILGEDLRSERSHDIVISRSTGTHQLVSDLVRLQSVTPQLAEHL